MPTHAERQIVPHTPEQLFDLVADVGKYPQFLPWCVAARVRRQTEQELVADLTIGFGPFRETFGSRVTLDRPHRVTVRCGRPLRFPAIDNPTPAEAAAVIERIWLCVELQWDWLGGQMPQRAVRAERGPHAVHVASG